MHKAASRYLEMNRLEQKNIQVLLCRRALEIWERDNPNNCQYRESVVGTIQELETSLPRLALESVIAGRDLYSVKERYREPICALQDEDLILPEPSLSAYYAIYNLFKSCVLGAEIDNWLVVNQALSSLGEKDAVSNLELVLNEAP